MVTVSIIGTAGKNYLDKMDLKLYNKMLTQSKFIIENIFNLKPENIILVSGGAAWSDHLVIDLFLESYIKKAKIFMPINWDSTKKQYMESNHKFDCGKTSNDLHKKFSQKIGRNSLEDIQNGINKGLEINNKFWGFFNRNTQVAKSDYLIAFSWSTKGEPNDGGTKDTWNKSISEHKIHVDLNKLQIN